MAWFDVHPWMRFTTGVVTGCWIGVVIGCAIAMMFAGTRLRQLEEANLLLRAKLRARERMKRTAAKGAGPLLVANPDGGYRRATGTMGRYGGY